MPINTTKRTACVEDWDRPRIMKEEYPTKVTKRTNAGLLQFRNSRLGDDPLADGVKDQFRKAVEVELCLKIPSMCLDRVQTEIKRPGDVLIGLSFHQQLQNLLFAWGEKVVAVLYAADTDFANVIFGENLADFRAEKCLSLS